MAAFLLPLAGSVAGGFAADLGIRAAFGTIFGNASAAAQDRAAFAQASLNRLGNIGIDSMFYPRNAMLDVRDQFLADTIGQASTRMGRAANDAAEMGAFRDVLFGRANQIRMASMQTQPHPLEMLAGVRSFTQ